MGLAELKNDIKNRKSVDDIVLAIIFKSAPRNNQKKSNAFLQKAFYKLKNKSYGLLDPFVFDCSPDTPYSERLDEALFRLEASRVLSTLNPSYEEYSLVGKELLMKRSYDKFNHNEQEIIDSLGVELMNIINAEESGL